MAICIIGKLLGINCPKITLALTPSTFLKFCSGCDDEFAGVIISLGVIFDSRVQSLVLVPKPQLQLHLLIRWGLLMDRQGITLTLHQLHFLLADFVSVLWERVPRRILHKIPKENPLQILQMLYTL